MQVADAFGIGRRIIYPRGAHEEGDQPSITRVEVEVGLVRDIEIGLLHDQWHTQHSLVEIDSRLAVGANERDMVNTLSLDFRHVVSPYEVRKCAWRDVPVRRICE